MAFYRILSILLYPFLEFYLIYRLFKKKEDGNRIKERLGKASIARPEGQVIWLHAVSVGEANSSLILIEELLKFSVLYFFVLEHNKIVRPKYILVFGMIVSLGFAIHENYTYVFGNKDKALQLYVSLVRIYSAVPMHIFNGVIMGCFFAFYKHSKDIKFLGYSILIPIILHGSYNFLLGVDFLHIEKIIVVIMIFLSYKFFKIVEKLDSNYK